MRWSCREVAGLKLLPSGGDGHWEQIETAGSPAVVSVPSPGAPGPYLYFDVDDSYMFDEMNRAAEVTIVFRDDGGCNSFSIEYDNTDPAAGPVNGAFRPGPSFKLANTATWRTVITELADVRFVNRANKADFRLVVSGGRGRLTVREVLIRRLRGQLAK